MIKTLTLCPAEKGIETISNSSGVYISTPALTLCPAEKGIETGRLLYCHYCYCYNFNSLPCWKRDRNDIYCRHRNGQCLGFNSLPCWKRDRNLISIAIWKNSWSCSLTLCPAEKGIETHMVFYRVCLTQQSLTLCPAEKGIETISEKLALRKSMHL